MFCKDSFLEHNLVQIFEKKFMSSMLFGGAQMNQPKQGTKKLCTRIQPLNYLSREPVIFIDMHTYIPTKSRLFKTFLQENYAINCCRHIPM